MSKKSKNEPPPPGFEDLLSEAESLAERMEEGGLSLDESIRAYEKGVDNLRRCAELLRAAEEKVQVLLERNGSFRLEEFEPGDGDGAGTAGRRRGHSGEDIDDDESEDGGDEW